MRITLVYPSVGRKEQKPYVRAWQMEPLSMAWLAGLTPPDVEIRFYDDRMEPIPFDEPTDLVAISVETFTALRGYRIARQFRGRGVPVVLGGYHVTLVPEEALGESDAVVLGEAEPVWHQLVDDARHRRLQPIYQGDGEHLLGGLRPRRAIFRDKDYLGITLVEFARGCRHRCEFCSISAFHRARQHCRPARDVAAEMEATGSREFFIVDDNVAGDPRRARELCRELAPLGIHWVGQASIHVAGDPELLDLLVNSGCRGLLIGMESLDPANLQAMGKAWNRGSDHYAERLKRLRDHGLAVYGTFLFGYDNDDHRTVQRSVDFALDQKLFLAAFNHLVPFPGTPLYRRLLAEGRLPLEKWWLDPQGRIGDVTFEPRNLSAPELQELCLGARRKFYGWGSMLRRMRDLRANVRTPKMAALFLTANLQGHFDVDLRHGLQLGAGLDQWEAVDEPVSV